MTHSLNPHTSLTEPSAETPSGKGREGNKEGKGSRRPAEFQDQSCVTYRASIADRFWSKVTVTPGCWIWDASTGASGYGQFWDGETMRRSHHIALNLYGIEIPDGLECDHVCNVRACVNPSHIELVTHAENMRRRFQRNGESESARRRRERIESGWWVCI